MNLTIHFLKSDSLYVDDPLPAVYLYYFSFTSLELSPHDLDFIILSNWY